MHDVLNQIVSEQADDADKLSELDELVVENEPYMDLEIYNDHGIITIGHHRKQGYNEKPDAEARFKLYNSELQLLGFRCECVTLVELEILN